MVNGDGKGKMVKIARPQADLRMRSEIINRDEVITFSCNIK